MKPPSKGKLITVAATCFCAVIAWIFLQPMLYANRFYHPLMKGLTKEEVRRRVGEPTKIPEAGGGDIWIYQQGMDPDATVTFEDGRVTEVWTAYRDGFSVSK